MMRKLTRNAGLKGLAIVIAFMLWVLVAGEQESVRVYTVPVDYQIAFDRMLSEPAPTSVQVRVMGSESILRSLAAEDLSVPVDLRRTPPDRKVVVTLPPRIVGGIPSGAAVDTLTPDRITVSLETKSSRIVSVIPRFEGNPAPGFHIVGYTVTPPEVTLDGPEGEIVRTAVVATDPIPLHGRDSDLTVITGLATGNPRVRMKETRPVSVTVQIAKDETKK